MTAVDCDICDTNTPANQLVQLPTRESVYLCERCVRRVQRYGLGPAVQLALLDELQGLRRQLAEERRGG